MRFGLTPKSSKLFGLKPGSTRCKLISVRRNSPAPMSSNKDIATCATTSDLVSSEREAALDPLPLSLSGRQINLRCAPRRSQAENDSRQQCQPHRKPEHAQIQVRLQRAHAIAAPSADREQSILNPKRKQHSEHT